MKCEYRIMHKSLLVMSVIAFSLSISIVASCSTLKNSGIGITFVAPRGTIPAQRFSWSPTDQNKILVVGYESGMTAGEIYILDLATGQKNILVERSYSDFIDAIWAADGKHVLIFTGDNTPGFGQQGWWLMDVSDKSSRLLIGQLGNLAWSPDGKNIAILSGFPAKSLDLSLKNADTQVTTSIYSKFNAQFPSGISWSPDSQNIVFSFDQGDSSDLYVLSIRTDQVVKITQSGLDRYPVWSPTGNLIAFENRSPVNGKTTLHLIHSDGKCEVAIPNLEDVWSATWSPDGQRLGYIGIDGIYYLEVNKVLGRDIYQNLCQ